MVEAVSISGAGRAPRGGVARRPALVAALVVGAALAIAAPAASAGAAQLSQLGAASGCIADRQSPLPGCSAAAGLAGVSEAVVSPNGRNLYAAGIGTAPSLPGFGQGSLAAFVRDRTAGTLRQLPGTTGCLESPAPASRPVPANSPGCKPLAAALDGASAVAISPDGDNLYVSAGRGQVAGFGDPPSNAVDVFTLNKRGSATFGSYAVGTPGPKECVADRGTLASGCLPATGLTGVLDVEVSGDGATVYTAATFGGPPTSSVIAAFRRAPGGGLTQLPGAAACVAEGAAAPAGCSPARAISSVDDIALSPDGRTLVATSSQQNAIAIFRRAGDGSLRQLAGADGCIVDAGGPAIAGCANDAIGLKAVAGPGFPVFQGAMSVAAAPDGRTFGVTSFSFSGDAESVVAGALTTFRRTGAGALRQLATGPRGPGCIQQVRLARADLAPIPNCRQAAVGLIFPTRVAFAGNGRAAYVSALTGTVAAFARDPATGVLTQGRLPGACVLDSRSAAPHLALPERRGDRVADERRRGARRADGLRDLRRRDPAAARRARGLDRRQRLVRRQRPDGVRHGRTGPGAAGGGDHERPRARRRPDGRGPDPLRRDAGDRALLRPARRHRPRAIRTAVHRSRGAAHDHGRDRHVLRRPGGRRRDGPAAAHGRGAHRVATRRAAVAAARRHGEPGRCRGGAPQDGHDEPVIALALVLGVMIGLIVGAVGGGGAILALPVLIYVLNEPVDPASTASLVVVALAAAVGSGALARHGQVCWRLALTFSAPAAVGAALGAFANDAVSAEALILAFVPVMLLAAGATWQRAGAAGSDEERPCPDVPAARIVIAGLLVGALTGFFGVGGGFVIVPVLTIWFGVTFRHAVATSLVIITLTAAAALAAALAGGAALDVPITAALAGATGVGAFLGTLLNERAPQHVLGRAFAIVVAVVAGLLLVDVLVLGGPPA